MHKLVASNYTEYYLFSFALVLVQLAIILPIFFRIGAGPGITGAMAARSTPNAEVVGSTPAWCTPFVLSFLIGH